jgi:hypothetical protein
VDGDHVASRTAFRRIEGSIGFLSE